MHAECFHARLLENFTFDGVILGQLQGGFGEIGWRADIAGQVAQIARQGGSFGDGDALSQRFLGRLYVGLVRDGEGQLA